MVTEETTTTMIRIDNELLERAKKLFPYMNKLNAKDLTHAVVQWALDEKQKQLKAKA